MSHENASRVWSIREASFKRFVPPQINSLDELQYIFVSDLPMRVVLLIE